MVKDLSSVSGFAGRLALICLLFFFACNASGQGNADITSNPSTVNVQVGESFTLTIQIDPDGSDIGGAQISMNFNNDLIEVTDLSLVPGNPLSQQLPGANFNNDNGTIYLAAFSFNDASQPFDFATIECVALSSGTSSFSFVEGGFQGTRVSNEGLNLTDMVTGSIINITPLSFECEDLQLNNDDPCITNQGEAGEVVNCVCEPFDCAGVPGGPNDEQIWYIDVDNDGFGDPSNSVLACEPPLGYVGNDLDCNDLVPSINPNAQEICDGIDNDCDGLVDDEDPDATGQSLWYVDNDGDGFGDANDLGEALCANPNDGRVTNNDDCADNNSAINPDAQEVCDGVDNDCDGLTDDADPDITAQPVWYADTDGDGFGAGPGIFACNQPDNTSSNNEDCDDNNSDLYPGGPEDCAGNIIGSVDGLTSNCGDVDAEVLLYQAGTGIVVSSSIETIDSEGSFTIQEIAPGSYDLYVKPDGYLRVAALALTVVSGDNTIDLGSLVIGDIDGTINELDGFNQIGNGDLNLLFSAWNSILGATNFNARADLNCDNEVGNADLNLFFNEWNEVGIPLPSNE